MIIQQRMEAVIKLGEMPCRDQEEDDLKAQVAWFTQIATLLKELIDLGKKNNKFKNLAFTEDFDAKLRYNFPFQLHRKLRKCKGEGQEKFENMLNKIQEFLANVQEDLNSIERTLDAKVDSTANSETEGMAEIGANNAEKLDFFILSEHKVELNLKDKVSLDAYNAVVEYEKLDDLKAKTIDINFNVILKQMFI